VLRCGTEMDSSSSLPGQASWLENIIWSLTVSPVCVNNKGGVIIPLFEHISVCYVKPLAWAVGVMVHTGRIASYWGGGD
jgi:hypothetical protein